MDLLVSAVQDLSLTRSLPEIHRIVGRAARRAARADGSSLILVEGSFAHYVAEDGAAPGWKGRRIPLDSCLTGWCVANRRPVLIDDVKADIRLPVAPYWSTPVTTVLMVPVRSRDPLGALAVYWRDRQVPAGQEIRALQALADAASMAVETAAIRASLEERVRQRTAQLEADNRRLRREIGERRQAEEEVRQQSIIDELTGLYNRRGFMLLADRELKGLQRSGRRALLLYIDLDGLKEANDRHGHEAGDRLLQRAGGVLRFVTRETDVAARLGGDEFAVFMTLGYDHPPVHLLVERFLDGARAAGVKWSVGATATPPDRVVTLDDLLAGADEAMYRGRRARRRPGRLAVAN